MGTAKLLQAWPTSVVYFVLIFCFFENNKYFTIGGEGGKVLKILFCFKMFLFFVSIINKEGEKEFKSRF